MPLFTETHRTMRHNLYDDRPDTPELRRALYREANKATLYGLVILLIVLYFTY